MNGILIALLLSVFTEAADINLNTNTNFLLLMLLAINGGNSSSGSGCSGQCLLPTTTSTLPIEVI